MCPIVAYEKLLYIYTKFIFIAKKICISKFIFFMQNLLWEETKKFRDISTSIFTFNLEIRI